MRIAILGTAWPYRGGLAAFHERLATQLQREGHEVQLVTFTLQYPSFLFPGKTQFSDEPAPTGLHIVRKLHSVNPLNWCCTARYLKQQHFDLLITPYWMPFMAPALGTVARRVGGRHTRRIGLLHNLIPHEHHFFDHALSRYYVGSQDAFIALSRSVLDDLDTFDPQHHKPRACSPHPIYDHYGALLPMDEARKLIGVEPDGRYVLFFGFIREYKGLDLLLDAMDDTRLKQLGVKLIVAGEFYGSADPYLRQIERNGLSDRVVLHTDFIPDHEVNRYFCAANIVAQPYKSATQSGVTQIAYHFERPMLVTNVGGLPEIVPDGKAGHVVEPTPQAIADALVRYFANDEEDSLTLGVRDEKRRYGWDVFTKALLGLMQ